MLWARVGAEEDSEQLGSDFWRSQQDLLMHWTQNRKEGGDFQAFGLSYSSTELNLSRRPFISPWYRLQTTTLLPVPLLTPRGALPPSSDSFSPGFFPFLPLCNLVSSSLTSFI